jgi:hypothetical protein
VLRCISHKLKKASFSIRLAGLKDHAKYELERAGLLGGDSDYGGLLGNSVLELCDCFAKQGHSGASAEMALDIFNKLSHFKTLTPITCDPKEWNDVSEYGSKNASPLWQNKRDPSFFSNDNGKTWWVV